MSVWHTVSIIDGWKIPEDDMDQFIDDDDKCTIKGLDYFYVNQMTGSDYGFIGKEIGTFSKDDEFLIVRLPEFNVIYNDVFEKYEYGRFVINEFN